MEIQATLLIANYVKSLLESSGEVLSSDDPNLLLWGLEQAAKASVLAETFQLGDLQHEADSALSRAKFAILVMIPGFDEAADSGDDEAANLITEIAVDQAIEKAVAAVLTPEEQQQLQNAKNIMTGLGVNLAEGIPTPDEIAEAQRTLKEHVAKVQAAYEQRDGKPADHPITVDQPDETPDSDMAAPEPTKRKRRQRIPLETLERVYAMVNDPNNTRTQAEIAALTDVSDSTVSFVKNFGIEYARKHYTQ